ncbi:MAG: AMP-binding protein [Verrucomicrobiota bacterium]|nr:AMP-binding protein [Verrucomicrobiota bacterium]
MEFDLKSLDRDWVQGISGHELVARVQYRAKSIQGQEQLIVIDRTDPHDFTVEFFAAILAGRSIALANPNWGAQEREQFNALIAADLAPLDSQSSEDNYSNACRQNKVILIPTGGTTNGVKLTIHTWKTLETACIRVQQFLGGAAVDSCCVLPLYHVSGFIQLLRAYHSGGYICFDEGDVEGRCLSYVPTQLRRALFDEKRIQALTTARVIFIGGAPMPESLAKEAREHKLPVMPVYGMTETAAMVAAIPVADFLTDSRAGALPIGDAKIEIDSSGRIRIQSSALFKGYYGCEALDLTQGYLTGDEGYIDENERLHVTGRIDRLVISGGEKIDPKEVEDAVCEIAGIKEVLAVGLPDAEWGQKLVVYYTGLEQADWEEKLEELLVRYKLPKEMLRVDHLPLDEKGKFLRPS